MLLRLRNQEHIDFIALSKGAASFIKDEKDDFLILSSSESLPKYWTTSSKLIFVGAIGAVIRLIAPLVSNKEKDPAVLVIDSNGSFVVPLIGGHFNGAEDLAIQISSDLGADVVITGNARTKDLLLLDELGNAWGWKRSGDIEKWKKLMITQARLEKISVTQTSGTKIWQQSDSYKKTIQLSKSSINTKLSQINKLYIGPNNSSECSWHPATVWVGIGCERNTSRNLIENTIKKIFNEANLALESIAGIATIDIKKDEKSLLELSIDNEWPILFFTSSELKNIDVPNPSEAVNNEIGINSVAEASAILAANEGALLIKEKVINKGNLDDKGAVTIALATGSNAFAPKRGELHLIGSGPGRLSLLTNDARFALSKCKVWIGYELYLDLLEPLRRADQVRINSKLKLESERCQKALELVEQGIKVALISSGDSGIYGMAGLALEKMLEKPESKRSLFQIHPGISALQSAAAKIGAPLMNDFCAISLSDLLTPWEQIEKRILGAAKGDFVIAFYNPKSQKRNWQLKSAIKILLEHRLPNTPVVIAREVGRSNESIKTFTISKFPFEIVDMLTIIFIGNSNTYFKDGWVVNPRGYR